MWQSLKAFLRRRTLERDLRDEISDHIARDVEYRMRRGISRQEAMRAAHAEFGSRDGTADDVRDAEGITTLDDIWRDARQAWRRVRRAPAYALFVIITIGIGIGATTAIFSAVNGVLLRPLPYREPDNLFTVWGSRPNLGIERDDFSPGTFFDVLDRTTSWEALAVGNPYSVNLRSLDRTDNIEAWQVSEGFFDFIGVSPLLGRTLEATDFGIGRPAVAVLDHGFWQSRFGGASSVVGQSITLDGVPVTIVGVMPREVALPEPTNLWLPWLVDSAQKENRFATYLRVFGRLKPAVSPATATAELATVAARLEAEYPRSNQGLRFVTVPLREVLLGGRAALLWALLGASALLLLVTLANVAALHLTRLSRQRRETAVRAALGASRSRLVRPLVAEAAWLSLWGGVAGLGIGVAGIGLVHRLAPPDLPRLDAIRLDASAVGAAWLLAVIAAVMLSLMGARRLDAGSGVTALGVRTSIGSQGSLKLRRLAVGVQLGVALVLLIGTGLLVRSVVAVLSADRGYQSDHVLSFTTWVYDEYPEPPGRQRFVETMLERLTATPGVRAATIGSALPLADDITGTRADIVMPDLAVVPGEEPQSNAAVVWPNWFQTLGINVRQGRGLEAADDQRGEPVIVVNEAFARRFSPGKDILGRTVSVGLMGRAQPSRVVGVVADTRQARLDAPPEPQVYIPWAQKPLAALTFVMRTSVDPGSLGPTVQRLLFDVDPRIGIARLATMDQLIDRQVRERRFLLLLIGAFAGVAVLLACIGVAGVMSQSVAERTREIGVRLALGATPGVIRGELLRDALVLAGWGLAGGVVAAVAGTRVLSGFLFEVSPIDAAGYAGALVMLLVLTAVAALGPCLRATRVDPAQVLHD